MMAINELMTMTTVNAPVVLGRRRRRRQRRRSVILGFLFFLLAACPTHDGGNKWWGRTTKRRPKDSAFVVWVAAGATAATAGELEQRKLEGEEDNVEYSYDPESEVGPDNWKDLAMDNNQCGGTTNSPVALTSTACTRYANYTFQAGTCVLQDYAFFINNHVGQATVVVDEKRSDDGTSSSSSSCQPATLRIPGVRGSFELVQFHVHTGSEHTMNGHRYGAELHLVHQKQRQDEDDNDDEEQGDSPLAVIGIVVEPSAFVNNDLFSRVLAGFDAASDAAAEQCNIASSSNNHWWSMRGATTNDDVNDNDNDGTFSVYQLIPEHSAYYRYDGGLTTPPCTEAVHWSVADQPLRISVAQYHDLTGLILNYLSSSTCQYGTIASPAGLTSRPVQPFNGRSIERICPVGHVDAQRAGTTSSTRHAVAAMQAVAATATAIALVVAAGAPRLGW